MTGYRHFRPAASTILTTTLSMEKNGATTFGGRLCRIEMALEEGYSASDTVTAVRCRITENPCLCARTRIFSVLSEAGRILTETGLAAYLLSKAWKLQLPKLWLARDHPLTRTQNNQLIESLVVTNTANTVSKVFLQRQRKAKIDGLYPCCLLVPA